MAEVRLIEVREELLAENRREALSLVRRDTPPEIPATAQEMGMKVLTEKGKLEAFLLASRR